MNNEQILKLNQAFADHEEKDLERFGELRDDIKEIKELLKPIAETYTSASNSMKWFMGALVAISIMVGIVWGMLQIIGRLK